VELFDVNWNVQHLQHGSIERLLSESTIPPSENENVRFKISLYIGNTKIYINLKFKLNCSSLLIAGWLVHTVLDISPKIAPPLDSYSKLYLYLFLPSQKLMKMLEK
jgi:hypothetical protein